MAMRRKQFNQSQPVDYPQEKQKMAKQCQECEQIKKWIKENTLNKIYELLCKQ